MPRLPGELQDLEMVRGAGKRWGYGNCIQYLKHAWAEQLIAEHGISPETAARAAFMTDEEIEQYLKGFRVLKPVGLSCDEAQQQSVEKFHNYLQSIDSSTCPHCEEWGKCCPVPNAV